MSILGLIVVIVLIVFALWLVQNYLPVPFKVPVLIIVVVLALVWIASVLVPGLTTARIR
jgi:hypothetical protein